MLAGSRPDDVDVHSGVWPAGIRGEDGIGLEDVRRGEDQGVGQAERSATEGPQGCGDTRDVARGWFHSSGQRIEEGVNGRNLVRAASMRPDHDLRRWLHLWRHSDGIDDGHRLGRAAAKQAVRGRKSGAHLTTLSVNQRDRAQPGSLSFGSAITRTRSIMHRGSSPRNHGRTWSELDGVTRAGQCSVPCRLLVDTS